jgi:hypothetical protein
LVQIGGPTQAEFIDLAGRELLPALWEEYGKAEDATIRVRGRG